MIFSDIEINLAIVFSFFIATLFETLIPGPTLALVTETRISSGRKNAIETVAGITVANIFWVIAAIFVLYAGNLWFEQWIRPAIVYFGTAYLIYLASKRILSSSIVFITGYSESQDSVSDSSNLFFTGFMAHAGNPLTIAYYIATFGIATSGQPLEIKVLFGLIAIFSDLLVYGIIAGKNIGEVENILKKPVIRLIAGCALFYLISLVYSNQDNLDQSLTITPLIMIVMLIAFLLAALHVAYDNVRSRINKNNILLWRVAKLWSIWFSIYAILGMFYSLVSGIEGSALSFSDAIETRIRICVIVSMVLALVLSFVKSFGEVQDTQNANSDLEPIRENCWQTSPIRVAIATLIILLAVFILMTVTNFNVQ